MTPGRGRSLQDRVAVRPGVPDDAPGAPLPVRQGPVHCWVQDPPEAPGRWPGLLLSWARSPSGAWRGQVAYAFLRGREVVLVQAWLEAGSLRRR